MSKLVAIMSMSLDGYVADLNDGVAEVFDWYFSGDVEIHTGGSDPMTFRVSRQSAEHIRGLTSGLGAVLTGRRTFEVADGWGGNHAWGPAFVLTHRVPAGWPAQLDGPLRHRRTRKRRASSQSGRRRKVRRRSRRRHHSAITQCWFARRNQRRHRGGVSWLRHSTLRPPGQYACRPWQPDGDRGRRRYASALPSAQGIAGVPAVAGHHRVVLR